MATTPIEGGCGGHGIGGVPPVTNLAHRGLIVSLGTVSIFNTNNVTWNGEPWDAEAVPSGTSFGLRSRFRTSPSDPGDGAYTGAIEIRNPNPTSLTMSFDVGDVCNLFNVIIPAGTTYIYS